MEEWLLVWVQNGGIRKEKIWFDGGGGWYTSFPLALGFGG